MVSEFKGVFPAPPTPVTDDGRIAEPALRALLADNIAHGAHGFWIAGSTGEGPVLTDAQRDAAARIAAEACRGKARVIMHVGAIGTASAVQAARAAKAAGCDAVSCMPPFLFRCTERSLIEHYKAVVEAADGLPFFVYNLPQLTQVEIDPPLMEKLLREIPGIKGLKHSAPDFSHIRVFADMGLLCFSGNGAFPLPALTMGAVGSIDAPLALAPWHYAALFAAWEAGDIVRAKELQDGVRKYADLVWMFDAPAHVCKTVLSARLGIDCGAPVPPVNRLGDEEKRQVLRRAESLGLTERHV